MIAANSRLQKPSLDGPGLAESILEGFFGKNNLERPLAGLCLFMPLQAPARDQQLIQIVNSALADAFQKSSQWLACKPGCSQCCVGVFAINQLDAIRLRKGLPELEHQDPQRAARIRERVNATVEQLSPDFPGDPATGLLNTDDSDEACKQWDD